MDGANDVAMVDSDAVRDAQSPPSSGYDMGDSACSGMSSEVPESTIGMDVDSVHQPPCSTAARTRSQSGSCSDNPSREKEDGEGYTSNDGVVNREALAALAAIPDDALLERARKIVTSVADGPVASGAGGRPRRTLRCAPSARTQAPLLPSALSRRAPVCL